MKEYLVVYSRTSSSWGAHVPDLPGCVAVGDTLDEVRGLISEALAMHLEAMRDAGEPIPEPSSSAGMVKAG
ncbi:MAG: type II toxin-antitoxin system HicB family antitoxin [Fimbriimonas ginsengisoli]|uniref:Type II toxin-antitoxin system HicB family antitoxin n=1 Tax=Fimbriimonas ginsengisoli TaxID=1005039 RepID=A0A931LS33_FIMGI|nr:type II toxin-antitoxin system HicB family antitoxin [Fimbriimonas ginsengisoli]